MDAALFSRVLAAAHALAGVEATRRYDGATILKHDGRFMAGPAMHVSAGPDSLVVKITPEERAHWLDEAGDVYYVTDFYRPNPVVLVRLRRVDDDTLAAVLRAARNATVSVSARR